MSPTPRSPGRRMIRRTAFIRHMEQRTGLRRRVDDGFSLVEMTLYVMIFGIVMMMTMVIVNTLVSQSGNQYRQAVVNLASQPLLNRLDAYLALAVTPAIASQIDSTLTLSGTGPCWGTSQPTAASSLGAPKNTAIIYAHDYDIQYCGYPYPAGSSATPHVYEIYVSRTGCVNSTAGFCPLDLADYGTSWSTTDYANPSASGVTIQQLGFVWCDAACQLAITGGTPSTTYTNSCATYLLTAPGTSVPSTCVTGTDSSSSCLETGASSNTPPIFTYCNSSSNVLNSAEQPLDLSSTNNASISLSLISSVSLSVDLLGDINGKLSQTNGRPGATATDQVNLTNVS